MNHKRKIKLLLFLLLFNPYLTLNADNSIKLVTYDIPVLVQDDKRGILIDLTSTIARETNLKITITVLPPKRASLNLGNKEYDGFFPFVDEQLINKNLVKSPEPIAIKKDFIFTHRNNPIYIDLSQLKNKTVGITRGYPYGNKLIENNLNLSIIQSDNANAEKLSLGRIDAFIAEERTGLQAFLDTQNLDKIHYDPHSPIESQAAYYVFHDNQHGRLLANKFSHALKKLKGSGEYDKIMYKLSSALRAYKESKTK